ncbi:membrane protein [Microbacterium phage Cassita]|nr:membrane protein [Microbacterium phage Cassita]USH44582.1 membrane protein [Microbacterium phage Cassita]
MSRTIQAAARMAVYFLALAAVVITPHALAYSLFPVTATGGLTAALPACSTEDSTNCYWDATTHGNGLGQSFLDINGTAYYFGG